MHRGYLALWRKIEDHPFAKEVREYSKFEAWLDILLNVQHQDEPQEVVIGMTAYTCHYGQSLKSIRTWAGRWNWSESKVRRFLKLLKKMGQITTKSEGITTRISVINYEHYDPKRRSNDAGASQERLTCDAEAVTDNNANNANNNISPSGDMFPETPPETPAAHHKCPQEEIVRVFQEEIPELPPIRVWGNTSQKNLRARWREDSERQSLDWWRRFFRESIRTSDFLMGRKTDFLACMDWIVRPTNFQKIMNGNYVNRNGKGRQIEADQIDFEKKYKEFDDFYVEEVTHYV